MKEDQGRRVLAGLLLLTVVIGITVFVFFLDDLLNAVERRYSLVTVFPSAPRLRVGAEVWIGGREVGRVKSISFMPVRQDSGASIAVQVEIATEHRSLVRADSKVRFGTARLIGDPAINITPGSVSQPVLQEGDTLFAQPQTGAAEALAGLMRLRQTVDSLLNSARALAPLAARSQARLARVTANLGRVQAEFAGLRAAFAGGSADQLLNDPALGEALERVTLTVSQLGPAFQAAAARYTDPAMRQSFTRLQQRAATISGQLTQLQQQLANGSLSRFARDSALMRAFHQVQVELDALVAETRLNPLRFLLGDPPRGVANPLRRSPD